MAISNNVGKYEEEVILQYNYPELADVSESDYEAKIFQGSANTGTVQHPFIICEDQAVTLKVEPWLGDPKVWKFVPGANPLPLRKIFMDAANKVTNSGEAITSIQIGY